MKTRVTITLDPKVHKRAKRLARILHKSSTALRNLGTGAGITGCARLQGVDPASPAHRLETRTSTPPSFARYEFHAICGLARLRRSSVSGLIEKLLSEQKAPEGSIVDSMIGSASLKSSRSGDLKQAALEKKYLS